MEKQLKKIADELQLIRKELQKNNRKENFENITIMSEAEPILSNEKLVEQITENLVERMKQF